MKTNYKWKEQIDNLPDEILEKILIDTNKDYHRYAKIIRHWEIIAVINILNKHNIEYKPSSIKNQIKKMIKYMTSTLNRYGYQWKDMEFIALTQHFFDHVKLDLKTML